MNRKVLVAAVAAAFTAPAAFAQSSVTIGGTIDCSGGTGSQTGGIFPTPLPSAATDGKLNVRAQGGTGSSGFYRLEGGIGVSVPTPSGRL